MVFFAALIMFENTAPAILIAARDYKIDVCTSSIIVPGTKSG